MCTHARAQQGLHCTSITTSTAAAGGLSGRLEQLPSISKQSQAVYATGTCVPMVSCVARHMGTHTAAAPVDIDVLPVGQKHAFGPVHDLTCGACISAGPLSQTGDSSMQNRKPQRTQLAPYQALTEAATRRHWVAGHSSAARDSMATASVKG
jgi:hypothetical protein